MSTNEKIALIIIGTLLVLMSVFSYHEYKEPTKDENAPREVTHFEESRGQAFKIGTYARLISVDVSGGLEENCEPWKPVVIAVLHDIKEHLEHDQLPDFFDGSKETFEVNESTLELFCNKNATVILADNNGNKLLLQKIPFVRAVPPESSPRYVGTEVRIEATVILAGEATATSPTTSGDILIPDRFLDVATTTKQ